MNVNGMDFAVSTKQIDYNAQVAILGAGPVGLTIANYLSKQEIGRAHV